MFAYLGLQKHTNAIVKAKIGEDKSAGRIFTNYEGIGIIPSIAIKTTIPPMSARVP